MFTGLVMDCGQVQEITNGVDSARLGISTSLANQLSIGDSISVNGVCLTATGVEIDSFTADVMLQTLRLTSLGSLQVGDQVNLELAARADSRLGGHIVQGHVDGVGEIVSNEPGERWNRCEIKIPQALSRYIVNQGSITVDGVSLTVGSIEDQTSTITVWLIPETLAKTNLSNKTTGDKVNIEVDVLAKYVERLIQRKAESSHE